MSAKTATKPEAGKTVMDELEQMRAELAASRAETAALQAALESKKASTGRKIAEFPQDRLVDAETVLGKLQRVADRSLIFDSLPKLYRAFAYPDTVEAVVSLAEQVSKIEGSAYFGKEVSEIVTAVTTRTAKPRAAKVEKTVGDATATAQDAPPAE